MALDRHSLRIAIVSPTAARNGRRGSVLLQQESWHLYTGHLTKMAIVGWLNKIIFGGADPALNCLPDDSGFGKNIYAFPTDPALNYTVGCSNGSVGGRIVEILEYTELVQCNMDQDPPLEYPPFSIIGYEWEGDAYSPAGDIVARPSVSLVAGGLHIGASVYGQLRVTYMVCRHTYRVTIQPRPEYADNKYQSFFWAAWDGGTAFLEIEAPVGADQEKGEIVCNNRWGDGVGSFGYLGNYGYLGPSGSTSINGGDGGDEGDNAPYGPVSPEDETVYIDYCTQVELP